ncbi:trypsin-4-like isoform X3 [Thunnus albacares]|uniref:trypsin-4-like isoform X3 n=1 Tax=Thunnus albacares TaxID=8236 RepID=UPI001CF6C931|nr:trypsin-4-like isoform X3 [Thunnus albacares]
MALLTPLLLSLWVCVTVSTVVDLQKRIIGGKECDSNERLYHVQLIINTSTAEFFCGGSLISDQWILTAAHCWEPGCTINAVLGVHHGKADSVRIKAQPEIFTDYDKKNNKRSHDIMLLKLPSPTRIRPVPLPSCRKGPKIEKVQIAGHAATTGGPNNIRTPGKSPTLQCADIEVASCNGLKKTLKKENPYFYQKMLYLHLFCGKSPRVDACDGDSGGGVVYKGKIIGVVSFTGNMSYVCAEPVVFMDICNQEYMKWIKETIDWPKRGCGLFCGLL